MARGPVLGFRKPIGLIADKDKGELMPGTAFKITTLCDWDADRNGDIFLSTWPLILF